MKRIKNVLSSICVLPRFDQVLELGCGTGLVSLAALIGAQGGKGRAFGTGASCKSSFYISCFFLMF